ncbi:MAG: hypothetical protein L0Z50_41370 [Verrucomicrobiales bacterium]|nr:hypothetical protein [Verrucomicrobiales bacterium]
MSTLTLTRKLAGAREPQPRRSVVQALASLEATAGQSEGLLSKPVLLRDRAGKPFWLPRYLFIGPKGGSNPIRLGLFAGIHGDELEGVEAMVRFLTLVDQHPELARGYCLFAYPICNRRVSRTTRGTRAAATT